MVPIGKKIVRLVNKIEKGSIDGIFVGAPFVLLVRYKLMKK